MIALITKRNKPKVTIVAGNVKKINKGFTTIFSNAITTATIIAERYPDTDTPGRTVAKTTTAKAVNKIFKNVFILMNLITTIRLLKVYQNKICAFLSGSAIPKFVFKLKNSNFASLNISALNHIIYYSYVSHP